MDIYEDVFNPTFLTTGCKNDNRPALPRDATLTMAYIPIQKEIVTYPTEDALDNGTLFPALNKEFKGRVFR